LIESLKKLIEQSTQTLGPDAPSTVMLQQQLAAALEGRKQSRKVLWIQPTIAASDRKKE
jgi:hypothetical protein